MEVAQTRKLSMVLLEVRRSKITNTLHLNLFVKNEYI